MRARRRWQRWGRWGLTVWYLAVSTDAAFAVSDMAMPRTKTVAAAAFPCSQHGCGCRTAEECRAHCCCFPTSHRPSPVPEAASLPRSEASVDVTLNARAEAECDGHDDAAESGHRLAPHLPASACRGIARAMPSSVVNTLIVAAFSSPDPDLPDKVPL